MLIRLRSLWDQAWFKVLHQWRIVAAFLVFVAGLTSSLITLPKGISLAVIVISILGSGALLLLQVLDTVDELGMWSSSVPRVDDERFSALRDPSLPTVLECDQGHIAIDPALDARLTTATIPFTWYTSRYSLPAKLAKHRQALFRIAAQRGWPFNGRKVSLGNAIRLDTTHPVALSGARHFDSLCADELTRYDTSHALGKVDFRAEFVAPQGELLTFEQSKLVNGIGMSTLAVTTDGFLVVTLQSSVSQTSGSRWAPSGSGALEPKDRHAANGDLLRMVAIGAERELREEARVRPEWVFSTVPIGYARWFERGGKPEFYLLTLLNVDSSRILVGTRPHSKLSYERVWTERVEVTPIALVGLRAAAKPSAGVRSPRGIESSLLPHPGEVATSASLPLQMALDALLRARLTGQLDTVLGEWVAEAGAELRSVRLA